MDITLVATLIVLGTPVCIYLLRGSTGTKTHAYEYDDEDGKTHWNVGFRSISSAERAAREELEE